MGGIFCATAHDNVVPSVMQGLADLEGWDCDSAGIAVLAGHQIQRRRALGPLSFLKTLLVDEPIEGATVLGHTRSATHGDPSRHNAHPHASSRVAVVHSGVVENHADLRAELEHEGVQFRSETDSEVIVWLLDRELANGVHALAALQRVLPRLRGSFALGVISAKHENHVFAARRGSPLAAARSDATSWLASETSSLGGVAGEYVPLEDGQIAVLSPGGVRVFDSQLEEVPVSWARVVSARNKRESGRIVTDAARRSILELPAMIEGKLSALQADLLSGELESWCGPLWHAERILTIGGGTSFAAAYVGRAWLEQIAEIPVDLELSSELKARHAVLPEGTMALLVSRSEEDPDAMDALRYLKQRSVPTVSLIDAPSSTFAREADAVLDWRVSPGARASSASAFTAQLGAIAAAAIAIRQLRDGGPYDGSAHTSVFGVPQAMNSALEVEAQCAAAGRRIAEANHGVFLGRGSSHPVALMGALNLEEISDIHAEGLAGGELRHRPALVAEIGAPVLVLAPHDETFEKTLADAREIAARGGDPILLGDSDTAVAAKRDGLTCIAASRVDPAWSPLVLAVLLQLIAYHAAGAQELQTTRAPVREDRVFKAQGSGT
ncbi:MAG: glutamine--fructose-6-phosphate transaminase (isomerizing) [Polyangiales bacterium]